jgi:pimeloyl-ACP methyl ester carboxylesterase
MPRLSRPDGAEIHWEQHGNGPTVVIAPHAWSIPENFDELIAVLEDDHRLIRYDARGSGSSSRRGPHDMETGAADLVGVVEEVGAPALVLGLADAPNRAVRAAAERPDLISAVVAVASAPVPRKELSATEALIGSQTVVDAWLEMLATDYRGAMRPLMTSANPQLDEDQVRERIDKQVAYTPHDALVERLLAWNDDDPSGPARALGDRLWLAMSPDTAGPWFPSIDAIEDILRRLLPDAHRVNIEQGIVSRPDLTADVIRRITAGLLADAGHPESKR